MPRKSAVGQLKGPVLVSACLLGIPCRYNGKSKVQPAILENHDIIPVPVCPEQLGGLPTPRPPAHFVGGDGQEVLDGRAVVLDRDGRDVTTFFIDGARYTCEIARLLRVEWAILKERSPSCGIHHVWLEDRLIHGLGVTAAMLKQMGISLMNEDGEP